MNGPCVRSRGGHFVSQHGRLMKAGKIDAVLKDYLRTDAIEGNRILDIGSGLGLIAGYFAERNDVSAVDIVDNLDEHTRESVEFTLVGSERLPFPDHAFDIVISNHVIEHVRGQALHLREVKRVLRPGGVCYLATPNRNFICEPHYKIPLIHFFPSPIFHRCLRVLGIYKEDIFLLRHVQMVALFSAESFRVTEYTGKILKFPIRFHLGVSITRFVPRRLLDTLQRVSPTCIFVLERWA